MIRVWVDDWQMQCCGKPFRVGDRIEWTVSEPDPDYFGSVLGADLAATVTWYEEHHQGEDEKIEPVTGSVTAIQSVHCRYAPVDGSNTRTLYPVTGTADLRDVPEADGWEAENADLRFVAYLVDIADE